MSGKTVTVTGATGTQGKSIVTTLLKAGWKVKAVTRKPDGDAAKGLAQEGATIVQADLDDEASLVKAFEVCPFSPTDRNCC
jgi:uncharacterized protein YbjT (DUF2867 family)